MTPPARITALMSCILLWLASAVVSAQAPAPSEQIRRVGKNLGFQKSDLDRLLKGEIVSRDLNEGSKKELAVAVAIIIQAPFAEVFDRLEQGAVDEVDKTILAHGTIPEGGVDAESFASLNLDASELDKLLQVKPGSDFNLSSAEIERLQGIAKASASAAAQQQRLAIAQGYREILAGRVNAYRKGGVSAIAAYTRGKDEAQPAQELALALDEMQHLAERAPGFYQAFENFPASTSPSIANQIGWQIQSVQERPTVVLSHRAIERHQDHAIVGRRNFYVGQSFNSLQIIAGAFAYGEQTLVFYTNRTFTDQVAGFGSSAAHKIGRKMMLGEIEKLFSAVRDALAPRSAGAATAGHPHTS
jgi:hypothetical protein